MKRFAKSVVWLSCAVGCAGAEGPEREVGVVEQAVSGDAIAGLSSTELAAFAAGRDAFNELETIEEGLGPIFNERSCGRCHSVGGIGGSGTQYEQRAGKLANGVFDSLTSFGGQLFERFTVMNLTGNERANVPNCTLKKNGEQIPDAATVRALRRTTALFGLGLVDNTPDAVFIDLAAKQPPGIQGTVNMVHNIRAGTTTVGKFGWKAQVPTLVQFSGDAYLNEMGITNQQFPNEQAPQGIGGSIAACDLLPESEGVFEDQTDEDVLAFTTFMQMLAPVAPTAPDAQASAGSKLFDSVGCAGCHVRSLTSGTGGDIAALRGIEYHPFSDFLLHDMGSLGDGIGDNGLAALTQMRTAPLWGLRLVDAKHQLLHDGRATSLQDAITRHDGQGLAARNAFTALSSQEQNNLLAFLKTL